MLKVGCANVYGDREGVDRNWHSRMPVQASIIHNSGCDIFALTEAYDYNDGNLDLLAELRELNSDWSILEGRLGNMLLYKRSRYSHLSTEVHFIGTGDDNARNYTDHRLMDDDTGIDFHIFNTHLWPGRDASDEAERAREANIIAAHAANVARCVITGDFNAWLPSATRDAFRSVAGYYGLQERTVPVNTNHNSYNDGLDGNWIDDILTRDTQTVSNAGLYPLGSASDHWGWVRADVVLNAADVGSGSDVPFVYLQSIRHTGDSLHLIDSNGDEAVWVPAGPQRWIPALPDQFVRYSSVPGDTNAPGTDPDAPNDPATPEDSSVQSKLIGWHKARLGQFDYSQTSGRLNPDSSGHTDCSGLQYACYKSVTGINVGTNSRDQADGSHGGFVVTTNRANIRAGTGLQRGDLIFYAHPGKDWSHVEMYAGNGRVVGISNPSQDGPRIQALTLQVDYFQGRLKVKRYV